MEDFLDCSCVSASLDDVEGDTVTEFEDLHGLFAGEDLVSVEGEVSVLHLLSELTLDSQVLLVGGKRVGVLLRVAAVSLPW